MKKIKLVMTGVLSGIALSACAPKSQNTSLSDQTISTEDSSAYSAILGGTDVSAGAPITKSIVAVYDTFEKQLCTGSLLPNNIVLTAAHCVGQKPEAMMIVFDVKVNQNSPHLRVDLAQVSPYWEAQQYNDKNTGDIALLHYQGLTPKGYEPATLLPDAKFLKNGARVLLAGFGITNGVTHAGAGVLRQVSVNIANTAFSSTEIELDQTQGKGACHGDSGGPAYITVAGKTFLWGATSRGVDDPKNDCTKFSAYTNALMYKVWIDRTSAALVKKSSSVLQKIKSITNVSSN